MHTEYKRNCSNVDCNKIIYYKSERHLIKSNNKILNNIISGICKSCQTKLNFNKYPSLRIQLSDIRKNCIGWKHSDVTRKKMSESSKGIRNANYGKIYSIEEKEKISNSCKGKNLGKQHTSNTKELISKKKLEFYNSRDINYDDKLIYYKAVRRLTSKQNICTLQHYENRGRAGNINAYHLDHKISKLYGFINNIPPYIISHIENLQYIPWKENVHKSYKCSIDLRLLYTKIFYQNIDLLKF